jgi:hypothetical protein
VQACAWLYLRSCRLKDCAKRASHVASHRKLIEQLASLYI